MSESPFTIPSDLRISNVEIVISEGKSTEFRRKLRHYHYSYEYFMGFYPPFCV